MRCERCEEPVKPVDLAKDWPSRLRGKVTLRTYRVAWFSIRFGNVPSLERPTFTDSQMDLCDGCWADLLKWANEPEQERRKIAARHRREAQRLVEIAEARREREINEILKEAK